MRERKKNIFIEKNITKDQKRKCKELKRNIIGIESYQKRKYQENPKQKYGKNKYAYNENENMKK